VCVHIRCKPSIAIFFPFVQVWLSRCHGHTSPEPGKCEMFAYDVKGGWQLRRADSGKSTQCNNYRSVLHHPTAECRLSTPTRKLLKSADRNHDGRQCCHRKSELWSNDNEWHIRNSHSNAEICTDMCATRFNNRRTELDVQPCNAGVVKTRSLWLIWSYPDFYTRRTLRIPTATQQNLLRFFKHAQVCFPTSQIISSVSLERWKQVSRCEAAAIHIREVMACLFHYFYVIRVTAV
jgi:hypothetical protein